MAIEVYELQWDDDNEQHLAEHGIARREVDQILWNPHVLTDNPRRQGRITMIGHTNACRTLAIALHPTYDPTTWRPVTGLPATPAERTIYDRETR